jgi:hypothetical protein
MDGLAVPLRVERTGRFAECDAIDGVLSVLGTMLMTSSTHWTDAPWFGLVEKVEAINWQLTDQEPLRDALNAALVRLGVQWVRVTAVTVAEADHHGGTRGFNLQLTLPEEQRVVFRPLPLDPPRRGREPADR